MKTLLGSMLRGLNTTSVRKRCGRLLDFAGLVEGVPAVVLGDRDRGSRR
jgi:hypothetical protein